VLPQVLLGVIIDSVFPQRESPAACARGALAKHIVEQMAEQVQASLLDPDAEITVPGPTAGEGHRGICNGYACVQRFVVVCNVHGACMWLLCVPVAAH
jgi:hypothetical protein